MNKIRRKRINNVIEKLIELNTELEDILSEEEDSYDSMGEGLQCSEVGETSEEAQEHLNEAKDCLENAIDELREI